MLHLRWYLIIRRPLWCLKDSGNNDGYTATPVACRWAGWSYGQEQWHHRIKKHKKKVKCDQSTDQPNDKWGCRVMCKWLKRWKTSKDSIIEGNYITISQMDQWSTRHSHNVTTSSIALSQRCRVCDFRSASLLVSMDVLGSLSIL